MFMRLFNISYAHYLSYKMIECYRCVHERGSLWLPHLLILVPLFILSLSPSLSPLLSFHRYCNIPSTSRRSRTPAQANPGFICGRIGAPITSSLSPPPSPSPSPSPSPPPSLASQAQTRTPSPSSLALPSPSPVPVPAAKVEFSLNVRRKVDVYSHSQCSEILTIDTWNSLPSLPIDIADT